MNTTRIMWVAAALVSIALGPAFVAAQESSFIPPNPSIEKQVKKLQKEVKSGHHHFKVGYSSALERSISELCGLREPEGWLKDAPVEKSLSAPLVALPSSYDWRSLNGTPPVRNQGSCGSCWAFGTVAPLESQIMLQCGKTVDLSEQYLISCNRNRWGCDGGWWAHDYHMDTPPINDSQAGAVLEADSPYHASDASCGGPYDHPYRITDWSYVSGQPRPSVQAIKQAIFNYGPVAAAVHVGSKFQAYSSGIFDVNESGDVNHAIELVGWNDDRGPDDGYWILRNSWGSGWGEKGYMRIRYGISQVGYGANYVQFSCPTPSPEPTPEPTPTPEPSPSPSPSPNPEPSPSTPAPDLEGSFMKLAVSKAGYKMAGTLNVVNSGDADAGTFRVMLYLSDDGITKGDLVGQATVRRLKQGTSRRLSFRRRSYGVGFSGQYLMAILDSDSQVNESDETNNTVVDLIP